MPFVKLLHTQAGRTYIPFVLFSSVSNRIKIRRFSVSSVGKHAIMSRVVDGVWGAVWEKPLPFGFQLRFRIFPVRT